MDYELTDKIKRQLSTNGFATISDEIDRLIASGSTGGEITGLVGSYLNRLLRENEEVKKCIEDEVKEFNLHAKSIGIDLF